MGVEEPLAERLRAFALQGVDQIGYAPVERFAEAPDGTRPTDLMPPCWTVVAFSLKHLDVFTTTRDLDCQAYSQDFTNHQVLHQAYRLSRFLERHGWQAFPIVASVCVWPYRRKEDGVAGRISLRHAGELAGLGRIGRNAILVTPEFGPRIQLGAVLTDAALPGDPVLSEAPCTDCGRCVEACPAGALREPRPGCVYEPTDQDACMAFRREHGGASPLGYRNQCALCRAVCPVGQLATA